MTTRELENIMKAFANRRRLDILLLLDEKRELMVSDIAERIKLSVRATSRHLRVLANAELVEGDMAGLRVYYSLADTHKKLIASVLCNI